MRLTLNRQTNKCARRGGRGAGSPRRLEGCIGAFEHGCGFTLVELLTVIAIIGILLTLLMSALGSAKKASLQARCISNLHQISLAMNMYLDDYPQRPAGLPLLVKSRDLANPAVLVCPADKSGGWGNLVYASSGNTLGSQTGVLSGDASTNTGGVSVPPPPVVAQPASSNNVPNTIRYSYLDPLAWDNPTWDQLAKQGGNAGVVACQLHGLGRPNLDAPSIQDYQGLILRGQRDGAVVKRQVFWGTPDRAALPPGANDGPYSLTGTTVFATSNSSTTIGATPWPFFSDQPQP
jgi:prepilin-type N-terminal cleavage/methylation domain-containing protein